MPKFFTFLQSELMSRRIPNSLARSFRTLCLGLLSLLTPVSMLTAQDLKLGESLYQTCVACHGSEGYGNQLLNAPALAGLPASYVETQLNNFKNGIRGAHPDDQSGLQMRPMSMTLQDPQAIVDVAAYIAKFAPKEPADTLQGGDRKKGETAYALCIACHGPEAEGNELLKSPTLQYQSDWYMLAQLKKFKSGIRGTNPRDIGGMQMRPMSMTLVDEQAMKDVIAHIRHLSKLAIEEAKNK